MTAPRALTRRTRSARLQDGADATGGPRRRMPRGIALTLAVGCLGALLPLAASATAAERTAVVDSPIGFEYARCSVPVPESRLDDVSCGYLTVPERRVAGSDPARRLRLPVVVIGTSSSERVTDPLVVPVSANPDASSLGALSYFLAGPAWVGPRDVVLVELRGDLAAEPSLDCPELDGAHADAERLERLQACRDRLVEEGVDPAAYTSAESAADLADLHVALEYPTWNLYGTGSGSRLAMTVMRDQAAGLRAVILDGAFPPEIDRHELAPAGVQGAVDALFARCFADAACRKHHPRLAQSLDTALARAESDPFVVVARDPATRAPVEVTIDAEELVAEISAALSDADTVRSLPYVIQRLAEGDADAALPLAQRRLDVEGRTSEGRDLSLECSEELPFTDAATVEQAASVSLLAQYSDVFSQRSAECAIWAVPAADPRETLAVSSAVPTLVTTGEFDTTAPAAWGAVAAAGLTRPYAFTLAATGRAPVWNGGCAASIARQFLTDPSTPPTAACIDRRPETVFLTTADIDPTSAVYRLDGDLRQGASPGQIAVLGVTLLLFLGTLAYGVVYAVRRRWDAPPGAVFAAVSAASLDLVFVAVIAIVVARVDPLILAYGVPAAAWPLLLLPFAALACAVVLVVLLVRSWMQDDGGLAHRVILTISALGTLGFAVWLLARGLLAL